MEISQVLAVEKPEDIQRVLAKAGALERFFDRISLEDAKKDYLEVSREVSASAGLIDEDSAFLGEVALRTQKARQVVQALGRKYGLDDLEYVSDSVGLYKELCRVSPKVQSSFLGGFYFTFVLAPELMPASNKESIAGFSRRQLVHVDKTLDRALRNIERGKNTNHLGWMAVVLNSKPVLNDRVVWTHERKHVIDRLIQPDIFKVHAQELSAHLFSLDLAPARFKRIADSDFKPSVDTALNKLHYHQKTRAPNVIIQHAQGLVSFRESVYNFVAGGEARKAVIELDGLGLSPEVLSYAVVLTGAFEVPQMFRDARQYLMGRVN